MSGTSPAQVRSRVLIKVESAAADSTRSGATSPMSWVFPGETLRVGRSPEKAQLPIETDLGISRQHFEISYDGQTCRVRDLQSANGTRVNGRRVDAAELAHGDEICAGSTVFSIHILEGPSSDLPLEIQPPAREVASAASSPSAAAEIDVMDTFRAPRVPAPAVVVLKLHAGSGSSTGVNRVLTWIHRGQIIGVGSSSLRADWTIVGDSQMKDLHFQVALNAEGCMLQAISEDAPTLVNGQRVWNRELQNQDSILAGTTLFHVEFS